MKTRILLLFTAFMMATYSVQGQGAEKTLVKAFNVSGQSLIFMDVEGSVEVRTWNEATMRVQMNITLQNGTESMLKSLMTTGRYNLESKMVDGKMSVVAPKLERQIKLNSTQNLGEEVSYVVFAPANLQIKTRTDETTGMIEH